VLGPARPSRPEGSPTVGYYSPQSQLGSEALLAIEDLSVSFRTARGTVEAVSHLSLELQPGELLGIVGESGSGKSTLLLAIARALNKSAVVSGRVQLNNRDVLTATEREMRALRRQCIGFVFQNPATSLNPVLRVGPQISERLRASTDISRRDAQAESIQLLKRVGIASPERVMRRYPHELSGGMCQRIMLAIALSTRPALLLADEPTSALDKTTERQILDLIVSMCAEFETGAIIVTHDLDLAVKVCTRVAVMYSGQIVEHGGPSLLTEDPDHPYTRGLLASKCQPERQVDVLPTIPMGSQSSQVSTACRFAPRCSAARQLCYEAEPALRPRSRHHWSRCWGTEPGSGWIPRADTS
jgi:peptide/nickel transport system ATP-binding protein